MIPRGYTNYTKGIAFIHTNTDSFQHVSNSAQHVTNTVQSFSVQFRFDTNLLSPSGRGAMR